jgi:hypothetical protein
MDDCDFSYIDKFFLKKTNGFQNNFGKIQNFGPMQTNKKKIWVMDSITSTNTKL